MKWLLIWTVENDEEDHAEYESWANSWEEVVGYFTSWMSKTSDVIKGEVICYWGDKPYGKGEPCLTMNICVED